MKSITEDENVAQKTKSLRRKICTISRENFKTKRKDFLLPKSSIRKKKAQIVKDSYSPGITVNKKIAK